jgi:hypothetical protein
VSALVVALLTVAPVAAQEDGALAIPDVVYPRLAASAASAAAFVPDGWKLEKSAEGDLNRDGKADLVLLLRMNDPKNVLANHNQLGEDPFDSNPRILAAAFADGAGYKLVLQNHTLIPRRVDPVVSDPIGNSKAVAIERGALFVRLYFFMSAGGWTSFNSAYRFRYQNGAFELIGFDRFTTERNSGETYDVSINYSTGKVEIATGNIESDDKKIATKKLRKGKRLTIESVGDGLEFDPMPQP